MPWHQVINSKTTVVTVLEIRGICVILFLLFALLTVRDWTYGSSSETARIPEHVII